MFDYSLAHWLMFLGAGVALEITPGPSMLYILGQTVRHGRARGLVSLSGVLCGGLVHVMLTVVGLAALIAQSALLFSCVKWIGAAYLIWLGLQSLRSGSAHGEAPESGGKSQTPSAGRAFRQGLLIDLLNPKVALFFLAFIPQFVVPGAGPVAAQLALHGVLLVMLATVCDSAIVMLGGQLAHWFKGRRQLAQWSERGLGALFIGIGVKLAMVHR